MGGRRLDRGARGRGWPTPLPGPRTLALPACLNLRCAFLLCLKLILLSTLNVKSVLEF